MEVFKQGVTYLVICEADKEALRVELVNGGSPVEKILHAKPNHQDLTQLFFINSLGDSYEIINAASGHCFDQDGDFVKLKGTKQAKDQRFSIHLAPTKLNSNLYWIKSHMNPQKGLALEGTLRVKQLDINDSSQLFKFQPVTDNNAVNLTLFFVNVKSGKVIDIPKGDDKLGLGIIQYQKNSRFHQRWNLLRNGQNWDIRSFKNGLCLDVENEKAHENAKIVQWKPMGKQNQLWNLKKNLQGLYTISPILDSNLMLGIINDSLDSGASLALVKHETLWQIEGQIPI